MFTSEGVRMNAKEIVLKLQNLGFKAYFVGGYVRDMILGLPSKDIDVVTSATPDEISEIFKDQNIKSVGRSFLVTFVDNVEVSTFRKDTYFGGSDKNVIIQPSDEAEDAFRRDFTINAIFYDPISKKVIDYVNGQEDLKNKVIRFVGDPVKRIIEDPNRIIRACRFLAKIDGDFDKNTFEELKNRSDYANFIISPERIRLEILKAMEIKKASTFFRALYDIGALKYIFPTLNDCYNLDGGPYHEEPVFDHCVASGDHITTKDPIVKLAGYLHDVGKSISCRTNPRTQDIWFEGHEETGSETVVEELINLKFSTREIEIISQLIGLHMRISHERLSPKGVRRTLKLLKDHDIPYQNLLRVSIGDKMGGFKSRNFYNISDVYKLVSVFRTEINRKNPVTAYSDLKVNGYDIMTVTGLKPGKEVGEILKKLLDIVLDKPELNEKEKLIELIKSELK
jgi:tRNA nucleotidyltransferase/poly(A) polymerase